MSGHDPDGSSAESAGPDGAFPGTPPPGGAAGPSDGRAPDDEGEDGPPEATRHELQRLADVPAGPPPPRRTGVLLDPEDLRRFVGEHLRVMLGGYQVDAFGNYTFTHDGARIFVTTGMSPIGPTVGVFSITNVDIDLTPDLAGFLLTTNHRLGFGAFSYDADNRAVWLAHTLLGTMLDGPELQATVMTIANTAAQVDDPIRDRFGGRAFHDMPEEVQQRAKPPEPDPDQPTATGYL